MVTSQFGRQGPRTEVMWARSWGWFLIHLSSHQILFFPLNPRAVQSLLPWSRTPKDFMGKDKWGLTTISISSFLSPSLLSKKVFFETAEKEPGQFFSSFLFWSFYSNLHFISTSSTDSFLTNVFNSRTILPPKWVRTHSVFFFFNPPIGFCSQDESVLFSHFLALISDVFIFNIKNTCSFHMLALWGLTPFFQSVGYLVVLKVTKMREGRKRDREFLQLY